MGFEVLNLEIVVIEQLITVVSDGFFFVFGYLHFLSEQIMIRNFVFLSRF